MITVQDLKARAEKIKKEIDSGKLTTAKLKKAKMKYYNTRAAITKKAGKKFSPKQAKAQKQLSNPKQGIIPGFLGQLNQVRIEELVADRAFKKIESLIEQAVERVFKVS